MMTPTAPPQKNKHGRGNKIMVGTVAKAMVGELEEDIREIFSRRLRKDMDGVIISSWDRGVHGE